MPVNTDEPMLIIKIKIKKIITGIVITFPPLLNRVAKGRFVRIILVFY
jgi:hypothetical protein